MADEPTREQAPEVPEARESGEGQATTRRVARNTIVLVAGDAATKLGLFVLYAVIASTLGTSGFGEYTLAISLAFFVRMSALGIDVIVTREVARDLDNVHGLFWHSLILKVGAGTPVLAVVVAVATLGDNPNSVVVATALIGLSNLIDVVAFSLHAVLRGREQMAPGSIALVLESATIVSLGAVTLLAFDGGIVALGVVYVIAAVLGLTYICASMLRRGIRPRVRGGTRGMGWLGRAAIPTGVGSIFAYALGRIDAVMLSAITQNSSTVGLYGGAYRIFEATLFASWAFGLAVLPILSKLQRRTDSLRRVFGVATMAVAGLTFPLGGAMVLFGPLMMETIFGSDFGDGGGGAQILGGAAALYGIFTVAGAVVVGQDRQALLPPIAAAALVVNVALNLVLIPPLGLEGAAIAMVVSQLMITGLTMWLAIRETGPVSPVRMFSAATAGLGAMGLVALALGSGALALFVSLIAYAAVFLSVEWQMHREDLELFVGAMRRRGAEDEAEVSVSEMAAEAGEGK